MRSFAARLGPFLPAILAALIGGCMGNLFRRGDLAEPPPKEYRGRGMAPGFKLVELDSLEAVDRFCRERGISPNEAFRQVLIEACVLDGDRLKVMPKKGVLDEKRYAWLSDHEDGHTWGLVHGSGGRGWHRNPDFFRKNGHIVDEAMVGQAPPLDMKRNLFAESAAQEPPENLFRGR